jgi:hypothetical protein
MSDADFELRVRQCLQRLDGSPAAAVALLADLTREQLDEYGGIAVHAEPPREADES